MYTPHFCNNLVSLKWSLSRAVQKWLAITMLWLISSSCKDHKNWHSVPEVSQVHQYTMINILQQQQLVVYQTAVASWCHWKNRMGIHEAQNWGSPWKCTKYTGMYVQLEICRKQIPALSLQDLWIWKDANPPNVQSMKPHCNLLWLQVSGGICRPETGLKTGVSIHLSGVSAAR